MRFCVVGMVVTQELVGFFFGHCQYSPCFIRLDILITFVGNEKTCFSLKILSRKQRFLKSTKKSDGFDAMSL